MAGKERVDGSFNSTINQGGIVVLYPDDLPGCQLEVNGYCTCGQPVLIRIKVEVSFFVHQQPEMSTTLIASLGHRKPKDKIPLSFTMKGSLYTERKRKRTREQNFSLIFVAARCEQRNRFHKIPFGGDIVAVFTLT